MRHFKYSLFAMMIFVNSFIKAQLPVNDPAWILQTSASEEFNSGLDTVNKWYSKYQWGNRNNGAEYNYPSNLILTGTTLKIKADTLAPGVHASPSGYAATPSVGVTYAYQGGAIHSRPIAGTDPYKYGYLEVYAKFPSSYYPLWPAVWLWGCNGGDYNEIDIAENNAPYTYNGHKMGTTVWVHNGACTQTQFDYNTQDLPNLPLISGGFHKYAVEWGPDRYNFYFDDNFYWGHYDPTGVTVPQNPMAVIINFAVDPWYSFLPSDWNANPPYTGYPQHGDNSPTSWPQYLEIDYLRYYKLSTNCNTTLGICNISSDYSSRAVQKSITTGGSCSPTINTSDAYTLRATDYVLLDVGTTIIDNGSGYCSIITMVCPQ